MTPELLKRLIADQNTDLIMPNNYIQRTAEHSLTRFSQNKEIIILTGVRRCGKSVLLQQVRHLQAESDFYFNFEDERLIQFTVADFQLLQEVFIELFGLQQTYYFDEIQNIEGWELFVRRLYNSGNKIYITGSNAALFSEELGTRLTGRYITLKIFPLSFYECLQANDPELLQKKIWSTIEIGLIKKQFKHYCQLGGFPGYVQYQQPEYLHSLYESILYRDIIARYKIMQSKPLKELVFFLASNCSKEMTYNALRKLLGIGSASTVSDYCGYLENSHLCLFVNRYHESVKVQIQSPKKIYFIDHVLAKHIGFRFSDDMGRILENIVCIELKRRHYDIYYHRENKECDFIVRQQNTIVCAIQVCKDLSDPITKAREVDGLLEALKRYSLDEGVILTENEEEVFTVTEQKDYKIKVIPIWKWLLNYS